MSAAIKHTFLLLVALHVVHACEEYRFGSVEENGTARFFGDLLNTTEPRGFIAANALLAGFGLWCYLVPLRQAKAWAGLVIWLSVLFEFGDGARHMVRALTKWAYDPGLLSAPLLFLTASYLAAVAAAGFNNADSS